MPNTSLIGKKTPPGVAEASAEEIARFCEAVGDVRPEYLGAGRDPTGAPLAPPTYPMRFLFDALRPDLFFELGLNLAGIVHAEQEFVYQRPIRAGERYAVTGRIHDVWEKRGRSGLLDFVTFEARGCEEASGEPVFAARMTLISRRLEQ